MDSDFKSKPHKQKNVQNSHQEHIPHVPDPVHTEIKANKKSKLINTGVTILNVIVFLVVVGISRTYPLPALIFSAIWFSVILGVAINKHSYIKSHGGDTTAIKRHIKGTVAWMSFIVIVLVFQIWSVGGFKPSISNASSTDLASQAAQAAKSSYNLPYNVDSLTTLTDITSDGNAVQYHYIIHDADTSNVTNDSLEASIKPNVCANSSTKQLLDSGVDMNYQYIVKETGTPYSFTITQSDC